MTFLSLRSTWLSMYWQNPPWNAPCWFSMFLKRAQISLCFSFCVLTLEVSDHMQGCDFGKGGEWVLQDRKCILGSFWVFYVSSAMNYSLYEQEQESSRMGKKEVEIALKVQYAWPVWLSGWLWTHSPRVGTIVFLIFPMRKWTHRKIKWLTQKSIS